MSVKYETFRSITDEGLVDCLNTMTKYGTNFSVISINQVRGSWVVFYSVEDNRECGWMGCGNAKCETSCSGVKREPVDRSWVETVPLKDAHKEIPLSGPSFERVNGRPENPVDNPKTVGFFGRIFGR